MLKVIYVAGKYRGKSEAEVFENIIHARREAIKLWQQNWAVICPHTNCMFMGSLISDKDFIKGDLEIVSRCDAIFMLKGFRQSIGAMVELKEAKRLGLGIYYEEVSNGKGKV